MKLVTIFDTGDFAKFGGLLSVEMEDDGVNEFERFFSNLKNREWLIRFFSSHGNLLKSDFYRYTLDEAIDKTFDEISNISKLLLEHFQWGRLGHDVCLDTIFLPLLNNEYYITELQRSKTKANKRKFTNPWCRLYAIRLERNLFIVTGGAIKLTRTMNESSHLIMELEKMNRVKQFLKNRNIITGEDLNEFYERGEK